MLVPALPVLATNFGRDISIAQMTVSLYMVGIALSQLIMGPLSDKFGRRPVLLAGLGLMVAAGIGSVFAETLPQLIAARFFQALGGASGMVISRAIIRDLYPRERVGAMISLVVAALMIAQMVSPLTGGLLETAFGWRAILYLITAASLTVTIFIALALPETRRPRRQLQLSRRPRQADNEPRLRRLSALPGAVITDHLRLRRRRPLHRGDPDGPQQRRVWRVVRDDRVRLLRRQSALRALRAAAFAGETDLVRPRAAARRQPLEPDLEFCRSKPGAALAVRHPDDRDGRQCLRDGQFRRRRHQHPPRSRRHRLRRHGLPAAGHRRADLAVRRLSRRPLHHHAAADLGNLRDLDRLRLHHDLHRSAAECGGERRADRAGGGG
ncbi:MFS transporter [Bradyrhizobium sp. 6(2017)]|uniref:MFS transporter n=1 Tax=Bradyrhizobium sp. 6(2017) TaxID=1197460 RepID=UPI0039C8BB92